MVFSVPVFWVSLVMKSMWYAAHIIEKTIPVFQNCCLIGQRHLVAVSFSAGACAVIKNTSFYNFHIFHIFSASPNFLLTISRMTDQKGLKALGHLDPSSTAIFICDLQEKFAPSILHFDTIVGNSVKIVQAANILGIPVVVTEQYPKGLGPTVQDLRSLINETPIPKTKFSMVVPEVESKMDRLRAAKTANNQSFDTVILCGIETHVCVISTFIDLCHRGYNVSFMVFDAIHSRQINEVLFQVHVVADAVSNRSQTDRHFALRRMERQEAHLTTTESLILNLAGDAQHEHFKELQKLIRVLPNDTGLV